MELTLVPAYGRDYKTKAAVLKDWENGKDFKIAGGGPYTSVRDMDQFPGDHVCIRYNKLTEVIIVNK